MKSKLLFVALLLFSNYSYGQLEKFPVRVLVLIPKIFDSYEIGVMNIDTLLGEYKTYNKEYYQGEVPYQNWKNRKAPLPWNYHAELIRDPNANLSTDWVRQCQARFIPGYRILIEHGFGEHALMPIRDIEMVFENNVLISFTGDVDSNFYKPVYFANGTPRVVEKRDTVGVGANKVILKKKQYTWRKGDVKAEVTVTQHLNIHNKVYATGVFTMTDSVRNAIYLKKVEAQKLILAKEYAAGSKRS